MWKGPIMPRAPTWVPPHSSIDSGPADTTRTRSPYFSPKKAMAPMAWASAQLVSVTPTASSPRTAALTRSSTASSSAGLRAP